MTDFPSERSHGCRITEVAAAADVSLKSIRVLIEHCRASMNTFIIPGGLSHLHTIVDYLNDDVCGILIHEKIDDDDVGLSGKNVSEIDPGAIADKIYTLNSLIRVAGQEVEERDKLDYEKCLSSILSDARVHYLATRSYLNSAFNNAIMIERIVLNSVLIIRRTNPSRLIASSTPHSLEAWIFAKCFECLSLPVYILERTPVFDRAWIYSGLDEQRVVRLAREDAKDEPISERYMTLIKEQRISEAGSKNKHGFYVSRLEMESVKDGNTNNWWSLKRELGLLSEGSIATLPVKLAGFALKRSLYKSYSDLSISTLPSNPFVVFFMHYQPERSSLPEGLSYVQQWNTIRLLSLALPEGWMLLVREHPYTWLIRLDLTVRTRKLYKDIALLENTKICSMDVDTFELIDKCSAVATLTGHVGFQAILRNKPAIAFGVPPYKDHPACFSIKRFKDLTNAFETIQEGDLSRHFTDDALDQYFSWIKQNSIAGKLNESDWLETRLNSFVEIYRQVFNGSIQLA